MFRPPLAPKLCHGWLDHGAPCWAAHLARHGYGYQELDQLTMARPVPRSAAEVSNSGAGSAALVKAWLDAQGAYGSPPGPVHLQFPRDMLAGAASGVRCLPAPDTRSLGG